MPLFNMYVMVDWSGSDRRRGGRPDCIWIAHGSAEAAAPITVSPASRTEAERIIHAEIQSVVTRNKGRALLCADFGYGYPTGFASLLPHSCFAELPAWRIVWQYLRKHIQDDIGTKPGQQPNNHSNRFAVANEINAQVSSPASRGPFWCLFKPGKNTCVPQNKPRQPFVSQSIAIAALESLTEERRAIRRSVYSAPAASAARSSPAFRASKISASLHCSLDAPPFGLSKPDGLRRSEPGSIRSSESSTPKSIRASGRRFRTRSRIVARCARCGTGRAISTQRTRSARNSQYLTA